LKVKKSSNAVQPGCSAKETQGRPKPAATYIYAVWAAEGMWMNSAAMLALNAGCDMALVQIQRRQGSNTCRAFVLLNARAFVPFVSR
jgi:hypothetical protein